MLEVRISPSGQGWPQSLSQPQLLCSTGPEPLPLPAAAVRLLPEGSVQNTCFAGQLTSRYLFEEAQGMLFLRAVPDPAQAALDSVLVPGFCSPWSLSALPCTGAPQLPSWTLSVSDPCLEVLHLPGRPCQGILEEEHLHSS